MRIDFNQVILTVHDRPLKEVMQTDEAPEECQSCGNLILERHEVDLRHVAVNAILNNEQGMDGRTKVDRYDLAMRIKKSDGFLEVKAKEFVLIRKLIGKTMSPLIVGQAWPMLDEAEKPEAEPEAEPEKPGA